MKTSIGALTESVANYRPYSSNAELASTETTHSTCERNPLSNNNLSCAQAHKTVGRERCIGSEVLRDLLLENPYCIDLRIKLARSYQLLGYPDLAAGESYKALLLIDEVVDEAGEYHESALEAAKKLIGCLPVQQRIERAVEQPEIAERLQLSEDHHSSIDIEVEDDEAAAWARTYWSKDAYFLLLECLLACGSLKSAFDYCLRVSKIFPGDPQFVSVQEKLENKLRSYFESKSITWDQKSIHVDDYPERGYVRRELYPWNSYEPDRFSAESLKFLNDEMSKVAPKLGVVATDLPLLDAGKLVSNSEAVITGSSSKYIKQLGVFARENIPLGEVVLEEKSMLTAIGRLHEFFCDACSATLPRENATTETPNGTFSGNRQICCEDCDDVFYCSPECHELAQSSYHPALCGCVVDLISKDIPATEAADTLYSLLLLRALAMAETQEVHPLELKEVKYIWGDYHGLPLEKVWCASQDGQLFDAFASVPQTLPFSFNANILTPLHMLEKMDVNVFDMNSRYDFWVFNTLYAKFRGTASARQGPDGRPEVSAVHPLWCLANHSCDPNVAWEWQGSIKFWTREKMIAWKNKESSRSPGIRKGEELLSHYCDVRLPVKERREWAIGALGGVCLCERCLWEAAEEESEGIAAA
ncbi:hypothetical protein AOQ84DRAFT_120174 [Glonium stellatum]|uniref:SET domain-containing protein n=1 Tax=Glonium stellatum TaxID=574774 RepID=A0A8E2ET16_9PEZI|nr:hypothetical protein AOQ84DRAFT_120174 [Glonium stellatum]